MSRPSPLVLLVEDEDAHAELMARAFERAGGFRLELAANLAEAHHALSRADTPALVITDLRLPDGSGMDLVHANGYPLVVITSQGDEGVAVEAMKAGALDYVVKSETTLADMPHIAQRSLREWHLKRERDRARAERQRADERLRLALQHAAISALSQDSGLRILWSHNPELVFGTSEVRGKRDSDLLPDDSALRLAAIKRRVMASGQAVREEVLLWRGGEAAAYDLSVFPHVDASNAVTRLTCVFVDVTERRRLEEALAEGERLASLGTASAMLAHEIGNPLNNMFLHAQVLERRARKEGLEETLCSGLENITQEIRRLNDLLHSFRALSRRHTVDPKPIDIAAVISLVLDQMTALNSAANVRVERQVEKDLVIHASADKLTQVLINLCKNAIEAMTDGGRLTVRATREADTVTIEVSDTGGGIPPEVDVFKPFSTTKTDGTGLGLAVVRQLVSAHAGQVSYTSSPERGTTFKITLPRVPPKHSSEPPPSSLGNSSLG